MSSTKRIPSGDYTISVDRSLNPSGNVYVVAHTLTVDGNLTTTGFFANNLGTYQSNLILNSNLTISDPPYPGPSGVVVNRGSAAANVSLFWNENQSKWQLVDTTQLGKDIVYSYLGNTTITNISSTSFTTNTITKITTNLSAASGSLTVDVSDSDYQYVTLNGNTSLSFSNWLTTANLSSITLAIDFAGYYLTLPAAVSDAQLIGYNTATREYTNHSTTELVFASYDNGTTIKVSSPSAQAYALNTSFEKVTSTSNYTLDETKNQHTFVPSPISTSGTAILQNGIPGQIITLSSLSTGTWTVNIQSAAWKSYAGSINSGNITLGVNLSSVMLRWSPEVFGWLPVSSLGNVSVSL